MNNRGCVAEPEASQQDEILAWPATTKCRRSPIRFIADDPEGVAEAVHVVDEQPRSLDCEVLQSVGEKGEVLHSWESTSRNEDEKFKRQLQKMAKGCVIVGAEKGRLD